MWIQRLWFLLLSIYALSLLFPYSFLAAEMPESESAEKQSLSGEFAIPPRLAGRVDFWKLIFTKYGEQQLVFHHRSHPEIIYSVLDFSESAQTESDRKLARIKEREISQEINRIRQTLTKLSQGMAAASPFERRVESSFQDVFGKKMRRAYGEALATDQIRFQTGIRERFREGIRRSGRYLYAIEEIFQHAGLPKELGRLPLVESSFDYKAYSSKGAAGIWQFTRSTGKLYLRITPGIDERRDPLLASRAAAKYLANSYEKLGTWPLAVTSYNHGLSGVMRAVRQVGSRDLAEIIEEYDGKSFGFASANFYAEFLAALEVERHWQNYFPDLQRDSPWDFDELRLERSVSYQAVLNALNQSDEELWEHNLSLLDPVRRGKLTIPSGFLLKVSAGQGSKLIAKLGFGELIPHLHVGTEHYNEQVKVLRASNRREVKKLVRSEQQSQTTRTPRIDRARPSAGYYSVKKGDTLVGIAKKHDISLAKLQQLNPSASKVIRPGQKIRVE